MDKIEIGRMLLTNCLSLFLCAGIILDLFQTSGKQDDLVEFPNKMIYGFKSDLSQIFSILMEISS